MLKLFEIIKVCVVAGCATFALLYTFVLLDSFLQYVINYFKGDKVDG